VFPEGGDVGENHHVAPIHPEYFPLPAAAAGRRGRQGASWRKPARRTCEVTMDIGNTDGPWHQALAEAMRDQAAGGGITINVNVMPAAKYWEIWTETPFGGTAWTHRPLGTWCCHLPMDGFRGTRRDTLTRSSKRRSRAEATLDVEARKAIKEGLRKIMRKTCRRSFRSGALSTPLPYDGAQLPNAPVLLPPVQQDWFES
jgi:peptide/nickel transport system substrate-binding protein